MSPPFARMESIAQEGGLAMQGVPREVLTPHRRIPLEIPQGVTATEFFNSPCNLRHLAPEQTRGAQHPDDA